MRGRFALLSFCEAPLRFSASPAPQLPARLGWFFLESAGVEANGLGNLGSRRYDESVALP
jgi:hypothetical protein